MQPPHAYLFMGLIALACRQPDHQPSVEPKTLQVQNSAASVEEASTAPPPRQIGASRCVVPMPESPLPQAKPAAQCPKPHDPIVELDRGQVTFEDAPSRPKVPVELARTDASRERGLMYRTKLDSESGMLFMWNDDSPRAFWMRNTCIPLDMIFIGRDGTIAGVLEQVPVLNEESRGVACPVAYVLEVNAGWVRGHKVAPGQHVSFALP